MTKNLLPVAAMTWRILLVAATSAVGMISAHAQNYSVASIPEELRKGAYAVVRVSETEFEYISPTLSKERYLEVITVLTGDGESAANFTAYTDMFSSLSGFSGEIYDRTGKRIRKIKKSELLYSDYSGYHLANDNRTHYCQPNVPNPPFTVKYEWEITTKDAVWSFPVFIPQQSGAYGIEKAEYRLKAPADMKFRSKAYNFEPDYKSVPSADGSVTHVWSVDNIPTVYREQYDKPYYEVLPTVYFSPDNFIYDGVAGSMKDWESYAVWQWKLLDRSSTVPPELKAIVADLTKDAADDMEKIRILYNYLAETTRYVSIQVGIGGFQPMTAEQVYKTKYGDCKALSNYLRLMLAECGIESHYVEIAMGRRSIPRDFANPAMSNHAILMVPLAADTLWVECTAPELPLGYRHNKIVGQNALVYKNGSAEVITVPRYADSLHLSERRAKVELNIDGSATARVSTVNRVNRFEDYSDFGKQKAEERLNTLRSQVNIPVAIISNPSYREDKSPEPSLVIEYDFETPGFGSRTGDRLFVPAISFRKPYPFRLGRGARKLDICIQEGYYNVDITEIALPEGEDGAGTFEIESLPSPVTLESKYGSYSLSCRRTDDGKSIEVERRLLFRTGTWPKEEFDDFKAFIEKISRNDNSKLVLKAAK